MRRYVAVAGREVGGGRRRRRPAGGSRCPRRSRGAAPATIAGRCSLKPSTRPTTRARAAAAGLTGLLALSAGVAAVAADAPPAADAGDACPGGGSAPGEAWPGQRQWQRLEAAGYRLGRLTIEVDDVYVGDSLAWYQRLANDLHPDTDPGVVRDLLLVAPDQPVQAERIYEAERALRAQEFLTAARIVPVRCEGDRVDAEVRVRDAWTLQASVGLGSAGGESTGSFGFEDDNFLGTGKRVLLEWEEGRERDTVEIGYNDPALFGSDWTLGLSHRELSDGSGDAVSLRYPFRAADQRWSFRADLEEATSELEFEQAGDTAFEAELDSERAELELRRLVARDGHAGWRVGAGWRRDHAEFGRLETRRADLRPPPELADRRLQGPFLSLERFDDRFRSYRNLRRMGKTEDYDLGFDVRLLGGRYTAAEGDAEPWFVDLFARHGLAIGRDDLLLTRLRLSGRFSDERGSEAVYRSLGADYYHRTSERNTVVVHGELDWRSELDPEDELYLGGFDGLLAYPDRFRVGDRRWQLHLEDRYVSDTVLFDTIQVGYTGYLEAGRIRGLDGRWSRTLANVGFGLRLGSLRSSFGSITYLTLAAPLVDAGQEDDYAVVVGSTVNF